MENLQEMMYINFANKAEQGIMSLEEKAEMLKTRRDSLLKEGLISDHNGPLEAKFDETAKRLEAARRGLGLANTLKDPVERRKHKSRILGNLNRIRKMLYDIQIELGLEDH